MAHHDESRAGSIEVSEQKIEERLLPVPVERRRRLVSNDQFGRTDQRSRRRNALLLADTQVCCRCVSYDSLFEAEGFEQPCRLGVDAAFRFGPRPAFVRKAERKHHIVDHRSIGQEVEHLEDDAVMLGPEAVARRAAKLGNVCPRTSMIPSCGVAIPARRLRKVDLPEPEGPTRNSRSPRLSAKVSMTRVKAFRPGHENLTPDIRTISRNGRILETFRLSRSRQVDHIFPARSRFGLPRATS